MYFCKKNKKYVEAKVKKIYIPDGNNLFPAGSRTIIEDCNNHNRSYYNYCKRYDFNEISNN